MAETLVIVESPSKAKTIEKYLGSKYRVIASNGHVRDLPKSQLGVDVEHDFEPKYITLRGRGEVIEKIRKEAKHAKHIVLATDPDREGEAISWHLAKMLKLDENEPCRVVFNEITKTVIQKAVKNPRCIDRNLVDAQQARRVLDRLLGYKISPLLWAKVRRGLSAGRVQSVTTKLICDREREILDFVPKEYWTVTVKLHLAKRTFEAKFYGFDGKKTELLYTIANRSADFFVTDNSLLVLDGGALKKIDLNKKSLNKINNKKNYVEVRSNVSSLQPIVANGAFSGMALMVSNAADSDSWKKFNTLSVIYADGTIKDVITDNAFGGDADSYLYNATVSVKDYVVKGDKITVYYTKTDKDSKVQLCAYTFGTDFSFDSKNEELLMKDASSSNVAAVKGIDEKSAFVTVSSAPYLKYVEQGKEPQNVPATATESDSQLKRQITIRDVRNGYVFYTDASSAKALYRYNYASLDLTTEELVAEFNLSSSWFAPVILGDYMYFLDGTKEYTYRVKLQTGDIVKPETKDMVVGKMTADDYKAVFESENE